ncbi:MAG: SDR family oxidoreductase [Armatimonadota bacterium]
MYPELKSKTALVTGAARGIGRAIAMRLSTEGVTVAVNYRRSKTDAQSVVSEIEAAGGRAFTVRGDVGSEESLDKLFAELQERTETLDILVANAAFGIPGRLMEATPKYWDVTMSNSARSLLSLTQRAVPMMKYGGRVISLSSMGGQRVLPDYGLMGVAKAAIECLTRGLAAELAPKGIIVNGILAGAADTKSFRSIPGAQEIIEDTIRRTPTGRLVTPEDVAGIAAFLASDAASMIVGQFVVVDGGCCILA